MTIKYSQGPCLSINRIMAYVDTLLSLSKAMFVSSLPLFRSAHEAFIHQLTHPQLDYVVGRLLQLDLNVDLRYRHLEGIEEWVGEPSCVTFGMRRHTLAMPVLVDLC
jgi:hypothetical protein